MSAAGGCPQQAFSAHCFSTKNKKKQEVLNKHYSHQNRLRNFIFGEKNICLIKNKKVAKTHKTTKTTESDKLIFLGCFPRLRPSGRFSCVAFMKLRSSIKVPALHWASCWAHPLPASSPVSFSNPADLMKFACPLFFSQRCALKTLCSFCAKHYCQGH